MTCVITPEAPGDGTVEPDAVTCLTITGPADYREEHWYDAAGRRIFYQTGHDDWLYERFCYHHDEYGGVVVEEYADDDFTGTIEGDVHAVITHSYERDGRGRPLSRTSSGESLSPWYPDDLQWVWDDDDRLVEYDRITTQFYYDFQPAIRQTRYTYDEPGRLVDIVEERDGTRFHGWAFTWEEDRVVEELEDLRQQPHATYHYDYDECGRVIRSVETNLEYDTENEHTFAYDDVGQLRSVAIDGDVVYTWTWRCPWEGSRGASAR